MYLSSTSSIQLFMPKYNYTNNLNRQSSEVVTGAEGHCLS